MLLILCWPETDGLLHRLWTNQYNWAMAAGASRWTFRRIRDLGRQRCMPQASICLIRAIRTECQPGVGVPLKQSCRLPISIWLVSVFLVQFLKHGNGLTRSD